VSIKLGAHHSSEIEHWEHRRDGTYYLDLTDWFDEIQKGEYEPIDLPILCSQGEFVAAPKTIMLGVTSEKFVPTAFISRNFIKLVSDLGADFEISFYPTKNTE